MIRARQLTRFVVAVSAMVHLAAVPALAEPDTHGSDGYPSRVAATYKITFNGFEIGDFNFTSDHTSKGYTLSSQAELSALLGAFKWRGSSRSSGSFVSGEPRPAGYTFDFKSNSKHGSVKMGFAGTRVSNVSIQPPSDTHPDTVPVKESHLSGVLDPLSAVMAVTRGAANPCARKIEIFDGKQRFDLIFSFRRQQKINETRPSGHPGFAFVCRVRYVPVAGYRKSREVEQMSSTSGIEVALRPVPVANLVVPYQVTIPTMAGTATMNLIRIDITTKVNGQIALVQ